MFNPFESFKLVDPLQAVAVDSSFDALWEKDSSGNVESVAFKTRNSKSKGRMIKYE
jgi:hypothetical protein